jgi:hypothetical protein
MILKRCFVLAVGVLAGAATFANRPASAQVLELDLGERPAVRLAPAEPRRPPPPPPIVRGRGVDRFAALRQQMAEFRADCEDGDRRACVRLGIIIGENRERRSQWRRENPELFFWEGAGR